MELDDLESVAMPWPDDGSATDGQPMARVGLRMAFYFGNGYTRELRSELLKIVEDYLDASQGRIQAYQRAGDRRRMVASPSNPVDLGRLRDRVDDFKTPWAIEMSAEASVSAPSHWSLQTVASQNGYLLVHWPVSAFAEAPQHGFRNLFQKWCSALRVQHAYAGLGFVLPVGGNDMSSAIDHCGQYATRFVGLDLDYPITVAARCRDGIRTVNWLTAIDDARLARVGDARTVLRLAGRDVQSMAYSAGTIFVAGQAPQIGDLTTGNFPTVYRQLGRAVAALRSDIPEAWFIPPQGFAAPPDFTSKSGAADAEPAELPGLYYTKAWLARFD